MLDDINRKFNILLNKSMDNRPFENEELFYEISSELIRLFPIQGMKQEDGSVNIRLAMGSGIHLLSTHLPFLKDDYLKIIENDTCKLTFSEILRIRNKYIHEPHNMKFSYMVSGNKSCSMGMYYREELLFIDTLWMTNIISDLNDIFVKIQKVYVDRVEEYGNKYIEYPCYKKIKNYDFEAYNNKYAKIPWCCVDLEK